MAEIPGLPLCHRCGADLRPGAVAYCSTSCRTEAVAPGLAGERWTPPDAFTETLRTGERRERSVRVRR